MKIQELLTDETKWTKRAYARDKNNNITDVRDPEAQCFCLTGAIIRCYPRLKQALAIRKKIQKTLRITYIPIWNDRPKRTFQEVRELIEKLDI